MLRYINEQNNEKTIDLFHSTEDIKTLCSQLPHKREMLNRILAKRLRTGHQDIIYPVDETNNPTKSY